MQYIIHEDNLPKMYEKLQKIEKKCKKYGCTFTCEEVGEEFRDVEHENTEGRKYNVLERFVVVEVEGIAKINNWQFVATLEHTDNGNIIRCYGNEVLPDIYKICKPQCEHCHSDRYRKDTYVIKNTETGEFKQVGRTCLHDYTNGLNAEMVASYMQYFHALDDINDCGSLGGHSRHYVDVVDYLYVANELIRHFGFISKQRAEEADCYIQSTSSKAHDYIYYPNSKSVLQEKEKINYNPESDKNKQEVTEMLTWIKGQESDNQYIHNLKMVCMKDYVEYRDTGLLASLPSAYFKFLETEQERLEREARKVNEIHSKHIGKVGDKIELKNCHVDCVASYDTMYGMNRIYKITDEESNVFVWRTSGYIEKSDGVSIKGTVKEHGEYNGQLQTELTRCKML
jgi:hypothetical protein